VVYVNTSVPDGIGNEAGAADSEATVVVLTDAIFRSLAYVDD
jgi:hypothetical protein